MSASSCAHLRELWSGEETRRELIGEGRTQLLPLWQAIPELREVIESGVLSAAAEPEGPKVPLRAKTPRKDSTKSTGGETGRRSGFRFRRRKA